MSPRARALIALLAGLLVTTVVIVLVRNAFHEAWTRSHRHAADPAGAAETSYDEEAARTAAQPIDAAMIGYRETGRFAVGLNDPQALAVGPDDRIYVGGERCVQVFSPEGKPLHRIALGGEPCCLAVGGFHHIIPGRIYVGLEDRIEVYSPAGARAAAWPSCGPQTVLTSITTTDKEIWVADRGNRIVRRYDAAGSPLKPIGGPDSPAGSTEFHVTSHHFDLAAGNDDLVYVVNPRRLHVEGFTLDGFNEAQWGKGSPAVADFFGCCNPAHLAVLPDGRFATAEKGICRVKIYSHRGDFETVVVAPPQLTDTPADLAADSRGRILVLDGRAGSVRIFEKRTRHAEEKP